MDKYTFIFFLLLTKITFTQTIPWDALLQNDQSSDFGSAVANAGDVNGDGYDDIIVGAYLYDNGQSDEGAAYIYLGSASGLIGVPSTVLESNQGSAYFGYSVDGAGDVNGDGYDDIIIGSYKYDNGQTDEGRAYIYLGSATGISNTPSTILESNQASAYFGFAVTGAGDINNDGYDDIVVGAYAYDNGQTDEGRVFIYHGSIGGISIIPNSTIENNFSNSRVGHKVCGVGDVNNDGFDDVMIGSLSSNAYLHKGSASGINTTPVKTLTYLGTGFCFSAAGDINGDGFDDILIGRSSYSNGQSGEGGVSLFLGNTSGINFFPSQTIEVNQADARFGSSLASLGDLDGDGFDDIIAGAEDYDRGELNEGTSYIFKGSNFGLGIIPYNILESNQANSNFGHAVGGGGDYNGDAIPDALVGAQYYVTGLVSGAVFSYNYAGCLQPFYIDSDHDGFGNGLVDSLACNPPSGFVSNKDDCDDMNSLKYPGGFEIINGIDDNCDGITDNLFPDIQWQKTIGGSAGDFLVTIVPTPDGGYIAGGNSYSPVSGDKTDTTNPGYWIVKLDALGNIQWQNAIGGGDTYGGYVTPTSDGGFIVCGISLVGVVGDKTEPLIGYSDLWIVKLNSLGNIVWQNTIGGSESEGVSCPIIQTADGGYIIGAISDSPIGGDKTENSMGSYDYWVIKLDNTGNIIWQNTIGGSSIDFLNSISQTSDGGYIMAGESYSNLNGDKTENSLGSGDYWVLKLNSVGGIEWQNTIGGSGIDELKSIKQCPDGGFILAGLSTSGLSGDKTEPFLGGDTVAGGFSGGDIWILKLSNTGNIIWQKTIGGKGPDDAYDIHVMMDGNFLIGGSSSSLISEFKSQNSYGSMDYWCVAMNNDGDILWDRVYGGSGSETLTSVHESNDHGIILGGISYSDISGNKTEINKGDYDYWIIKLSPVCNYLPEYCNSLDDNCNGLIDDDVTETILISATGPTTFCQGGSVVLSAIYSGATVQWKKDGVNIAGATSANYTVTKKGNYTCVTTSPCGTATSSIINVVVNKNPNASISAGGATTFCAGGSVTLTEVPSGGCTYQWYKGASAIAGATTTNYIATTTGNYKCRVTKTATGCYKNSNPIAVSVPCRESELSVVNGESGFTIYPNPANDKLNIQINSQLLSPSSFFLTITDLEGRIIYSSHLNSPTTEINISDFASGMYFVKVKTNDDEMIEKFIKN